MTSFCSVSVPDTWAKFSDNNIRRSQSERLASRDIRNNIEQLCNNVSSALMNEWNSVNQAFADRIKEYNEARNQLQTHLSKVRSRSNDNLNRRHTWCVQVRSRCIGPTHFKFSNCGLRAISLKFCRLIFVTTKDRSFLSQVKITEEVNHGIGNCD